MSESPTRSYSDPPDPNATSPETVTDAGLEMAVTTMVANVPAAVGRFSLLRMHAKGGLGEVYLARDAELSREVALKRIQDRHADDEGSRRRFLQEAEITARLEHPGVVPVHGLVRDEAGRPCYAMRFIKGEMLTDEIRRYHEGPGRPTGEQALAFRQLLQRFVAVCQAVAYAHSRGVIHRDLKPANVMLGPYGETVVLDWGLAKPVGRAEAERVEGEETLRPSSGGGPGTQLGSAIGTPEYMSPEQAAGRWEIVGPASDVYSLGATLYALLTGGPPFREPELGLLLFQVQQGEFRAPRLVKPEIPRPLEAACLKAMARRPEDRYANARELAAEVECWLADEPVSAYREPLVTRGERWLRRHRTLSVGVAVGLVATVVALGVGLVLVELQRREKERQEGIAVAERKRAQEKEADAIRERDAANEQRQRTRQALEDMLSDEALGWLKSQKELLPQQHAFLERALKYYREFAAESAVGGSEQGWVAATSAQNKVGFILDTLGRPGDAELAFRRALDLLQSRAEREPTFPTYQLGLVAAHNNLGALLFDQGRWAGAEEQYLQSLEVVMKLTTKFPHDPEYRSQLANVHVNLGNLLAALDRKPEGETHFRRALEVQENLARDYPAGPEFRLAIARARVNLGLLLYELGRHEESEPEFRRALVLCERLVADSPADPTLRSQFAQTRMSLGLLLSARGRRGEAEEQYRQAIGLGERLVAEFPSVPVYAVDLGDAYRNLGDLFLRDGRESAAVDYYSRCVGRIGPVVTAQPGLFAARRSLAMSYLGRAISFVKLGRSTEAIADWNRATELAPEPDRIDLRFQWAAALARAGDHAGASAEAEASLTASRNTPGSAFYDAARVFALSAAAAPPDPKRREGHAARTVALLHRARDAGYFKDPARVAHLKTNPDLDVLRGRADLQALLRELEAANPRPWSWW